MKPAEYAKELGISRQAVYAKIKRGILTSKNVEGKLYIVVDNIPKEDEKDTAIQKQSKADVTTPTTLQESTDYQTLLRAKDETINVLKGTVKDLKKSNKQISTTLRGEIDLLKEAFFEMRTLYAKQLEYKQSEETIDVVSENTVTWIGVKKFFKQKNIHKEKQQQKVTKRLKKAYKNGDIRLTKIEGKLKLDLNQTYEDILD